MKLLLKIGGNREISLTVFIVLMLLVLLIAYPSFLQPSNLTNIALSSVTVGILALGEVVVIITKGIDLSVGATLGVTTLVVGSLALNGKPLWLVLLAGIGVGVVAGAINGVLITFVKLPAIIVTLGTLSIYSGVMFLVTNGNWVTNLPNSLLAIGNFTVFKVIPGPLLILAILLVIMTVLLGYTVTGRHIYAIGNNLEAARLAGIRVQVVTMLPYIFAGLLSAVAGIVYLAFNGFSTPSTGANLNLDAIAAAVIGGTSIFGGRGSAVGGVLGALLVGIITEALVFFHLPADWNQAAEGFIILVAVITDASIARRASLGRAV